MSSKSDTVTADSINAMPSSRRTRRSRRDRVTRFNDARIDTSPAEESVDALRRKSQKPDIPHTKSRVRRHRSTSQGAAHADTETDAMKGAGRIINCKPSSDEREEIQERKTEFDNKSYEAPLRDHSTNQARCLRKSARLRQNEQRTHPEQQPCMKRDRKNKKGRKKKSHEFFELLIPSSCNTPVSAISMDDLEGWVESYYKDVCLATESQQSAAPVKRAGGPKRASVPSTVHSISNTAPLSAISVDNKGWVEELLEEYCARGGKAPSNGPNDLLEDVEQHEVGEAPRAVDKGSLDRLEQLTPLSPNCVPLPPTPFIIVNNSPERTFDQGLGFAEKIPSANSMRALDKRSDRHKPNLKKPSLDTVEAFLTSAEWEHHQRMLTDWRIFFDIRRPLRDTTKRCGVPTEITSTSARRADQTPEGTPTQSHPPMRLSPIFETDLPEFDGF